MHFVRVSMVDSEESCGDMADLQQSTLSAEWGRFSPFAEDSGGDAGT
jgi:hypothetical protein